jgi:hypothetical protein
MSLFLQMNLTIYLADMAKIMLETMNNWKSVETYQLQLYFPKN